tara:strand:- start:752 stop:1732 length:981 start_codon:yes stop_codon:yes gene_type:complete
MYTLYNLPKIISRILVFVFFISIFYVLIKHEEKNELLLFWINGIGKKEFSAKLVKFSLIYLFIQLILSAIIVPYSNNKAKSFVRQSNVDYLGSIITAEKFTDAVKDLTIFIGKKENNLLYDVFLKDRLGTQKFQIVSAKEGELVNYNNTNYLVLYDGKIVDHDTGSINSVSFDKTQINLSKYLTKTVLYPKIQEANLPDLFYCFKDSIYLNYLNLNLEEPKYVKCNKEVLGEILREILKRLYLPIYIPLLALIASIVALKSKDFWQYSNYKFILFMNGFITLSISEISIRYVGDNKLNNLIFIILPFLLFFINYLYLSKSLKSQKL